MKINLYTVINAFGDGKFRPGFRCNNKLFVLTSTEPLLTSFVAIPNAQVDSPHFKCHGEMTYITIAYNQEAKRYNNKSGGELIFNESMIAAMKDIFGINLEEYLIRGNNLPSANE